MKPRALNVGGWVCLPQAFGWMDCTGKMAGGRKLRSCVCWQEKRRSHSEASCVGSKRGEASEAVCGGNKSKEACKASCVGSQRRSHGEAACEVWVYLC